jgi:hypothetical protein
MIWLLDAIRKDDSSAKHFETQKNVIMYVPSALSLINFIFLCIQTRQIGLRIQISRLWAWLDLFVFLINMIILLSNFFLQIDIQVQRLFEAMLIVTATLKSLYYLRLIGEIAPLIDIIIVIVWDIRYFLMIYLIALISFVFAFYILGQN